MSDPSDLLDPVDRLAGEFIERYRRGERPAINEYAARHPELAEQIREVCTALLLIEDFGSVEKESSRPDGGRTEDGPELREVGDYRIVRRIGRGGMGVVYEAEQVSLGRRVALKILPFHSLLSPDHLRRFQLEARAAGRLHHPSIVPVHEVGEANGVHYYAMQLIEGQGLDEVLEEIRRLRVIGDGAPNGRGTPGQHSETREVAVGLLSGKLRTEDPPPPGELESGAAVAAQEEEISASSLSAGSSSSARLPGQVTGPASSDSHAGYCRSIAMIGLQVADALAHAHAAGVLHRDIKPSNLLLDLKGAVWVTDFGLAKTEGAEDLTHSGDLVGTLRYMGPERFQGWSDPRSDIYGLGVTLYELLTLSPAFSALDKPALVRQILHVDPPLPRRLEKRIPRDLETVVLKAIEKEPAKRYSSAAELAEDLKRFLENRPIVARRISPRERLALWFRRNPLAASLVVTVGVLVLAAAVVASAVAVHLRRLAGDLAAEQRATLANLRRASLEEAGARRLSRRIGRRHQSLEALARAAAIEPGVDLRGEAAACLSLLDLRRQGAEWEFSDSRMSVFTLDASLERYAYSDERGVIRVCGVQGRLQLLELPGAGGGFWQLRFSPDGRHLAAVHGSDFTLWGLETRSPLTFRGGFYLARLDFSRDGTLVAVVGDAGVLHIIEVATGNVRRRIECGYPFRGMSFHPDGRLLALSTWRKEIELRDVEMGAIVRKVALEEMPFGLAWHPSGKLLAAGGSDQFRIHVWEMGSWDRPRAVLDGHRAAVTRLVFSPGGDLLASYSYDRKTRLWDGWRWEELLEYEGEVVDFSADGRRLGFRFDNTAEVFEVTRSTVYRRIHGRERALRLEAELAFSPEGRWLASATGDGVRLWDVDSGDEIAFLDVPAASALFVGQDRLLTSGPRGLHVWPLELIGEDEGATLRVGPPRTVLREKDLSGAVLLPDDSTVVVLHVPSADETYPRLVSLKDPTQRRSHGRHAGLSSLHASPDGRWIAGGTWHWSGVPVWQTGEQEPVTILPAPDSAFVCFSPDGRWLVVSDGPEYRFLTPGTWKVERVMPRYRVSDPPGRVAFAPDGRVAALSYTLHVVKLIDAATGEEIATLEAPHEAAISTLAFSRDGGLLAASTQNRFIHLWDLRELRRGLSSLGLDWRLPGYPERPDPGPRRPRVPATVLLGELGPEDNAKPRLPKR